MSAKPSSPKKSATKAKSRAKDAKQTSAKTPVPAHPRIPAPAIPTIAYSQFGRPTKCTIELVEQIAALIKRGFTYAAAGEAVGISNFSFSDWQRRARVESKRINDEVARIAEEQNIPPDEIEVEPLESERIYLYFLYSLKKAQGDFRGEHLANIESHGRTQWQASAWLLERRFADEFGRRAPQGEPPPSTPLPQGAGNRPLGGGGVRYTEIYVNAPPVPLPTPQEIERQTNTATVAEVADEEDD